MSGWWIGVPSINFLPCIIFNLLRFFALLLHLKLNLGGYL